MSLDESILRKVNKDPKYSGKHVIIIGGKVYTANSGKKHAKLIMKLVKEYPKETPLVAYIPKEDTLILFA